MEKLVKISEFQIARANLSISRFTESFDQMRLIFCFQCTIETSREFSNVSFIQNIIYSELRLDVTIEKIIHSQQFVVSDFFYLQIQKIR